MHIKTYQNEFSLISSKEQKTMDNIFSNLNKSRMSMNELYEHNKISRDKHQSSNKFKQYRNHEIAFGDNVFTALQKSNLRISHQKQRTINVRPDTSKLSFKLSYQQNHRPIIKQKVANKVKDKAVIKNCITQQKKVLTLDKKVSKIDSFIQKQKEKGKMIQSRNRSNQSRQKVKIKYQKLTHNNDKYKNDAIGQDNSKHQSLPVRRIRSSLDNYYQNQVINNKYSTSNSRYRQCENSRNVAREDLPEYAKNIMNPCKIKGIQLVNRPITCQKKPFIKQFHLSIANNFNLEQQRNDWKMRVIRTVRQKNRENKQVKRIKYNLQKVIKSQKKVLDIQPWIDNLQNQQQNEPYVLLHK